MTQKFKGTAGSTNNFGGGFLAMRKVTADAAGSLNSISFTISTIAVSIDIRTCLFTHDATGGGQPGALKDWGAKTAYTTAGDKTQTMTQGFSLVNGTSYWIGIAYSCSSGQITLPTDTVNTYTSTTYEHSSGGQEITVRDSPVVDYTPGTVFVGLGASYMVWADQQTATFYTSAVNPGAFTLTGGTVAAPVRLIVPVLKGVFTLAGQTINAGRLQRIRAAVGAGVFKLSGGWHSPRLDITSTTTNRRVNSTWWKQLLNRHG